MKIERLNDDVAIVRSALPKLAYAKALWGLWRTKRGSTRAWGRDDECGRFILHRPSFLQSVHAALTPLASELYGSQLKPSYTLLASYTGNGVLPVHRDREQCAFNIVFCAAQSGVWPIYVSKRGKSDVAGRHRFEKSISDEQGSTYIQEGYSDSIKTDSDMEWAEAKLEPNDLCGFSGTDCWHYRNPIGAGFCEMFFFHFVEPAFSGSLD